MSRAKHKPLKEGMHIYWRWKARGDGCRSWSNGIVDVIDGEIVQIKDRQYATHPCAVSIQEIEWKPRTPKKYEA